MRTGWCGHLRTVYGLREREAAGLVAEGWILPVIDGVDEMDPPGATPAGGRTAGGAQPAFAIRDRRLAPVVLTCRADRYSQLAAPPVAAGGVAGIAAGLPRGPSATFYRLRRMRRDGCCRTPPLSQIEPLTPAAVSDYLLFRFPDPAGSGDGAAPVAPDPELQALPRPATTSATRPSSVAADDGRADVVVWPRCSPRCGCSWPSTATATPARPG